jgi:small-conductance mechanosensitive channel
MKTINAFLIQHWTAFLMPGLVLLITVMMGYFLKRWIFKLAQRWTERTQSRLDDMVIPALKRPFMLWVMILGLHLAMQASKLPRQATHYASQCLLILWIISLTFVAAGIASGLVKHYGKRWQGALPVTTLTQNLAWLSIGILGVLAILNTFGISITPILTALGVGGLAVALALQDTLSNFFAGFYVSVAGQIRIGDYVRLESGEEGYITDITWRSTTLRALANNLIIVPNAKLSQAIVTNYHLPEKRMSLLIPIGVSYDSDPGRVEEILIEEVVRGAQTIPGLLTDPAPFVRFIPGFGDSSLNFTLICQVREFVDQYLAQHELRKRIFQRFRQEKIEIPFPCRNLYVQDLSRGNGRENLELAAKMKKGNSIGS